MRVLLLASVTALIVGCQGAGFSTVAESDAYTLVRGERWKNVVVGGEPLRSADMVCRRSECYRMIGRNNLSVELKRKYQLSNPDYTALAAVSGVDQQGRNLLLPVDLGRALFREAWRYNRTSNRQR